MASPTVLLVDDDPVVLEVFGEALRLAGYQVVATTNGRDALAELRRAPVDLVVTDLFMPEIDGLELLRTLRRRGSTAPVIAISAGGQLEQLQLLELARALGAAVTLEKPVDVDDLVRAARALAPADPPPERSPAAAPGAVRPVALHVLVADDERAVLNLLDEILTRDGHRVDTAANGLDALARLEAEAYDVVVTDVRMPGLDGIGLYHEIERRRPHLASRVVFLTGALLDSAVAVFLERTGALTLEKPFTPQEVRAAVRRAAGGETGAPGP